MNRAQLVLARFDSAEYRLCRGLNRAAGHIGLCGTFRIASRLGDGVLWYLMLAALPLIYGTAAIRPVLVMMATGLAGLLIQAYTYSAMFPFVAVMFVLSLVPLAILRMEKAIAFRQRHAAMGGNSGAGSLAS